jgi:hypothetical protein
MAGSERSTSFAHYTRNAAIVLLLATGVLTATGVIDNGQGLVTAGIFFLALVAASAGPRIGDRMTKAKAGLTGFEFNFVAEAQAAAAGTPPEEEPEPDRELLSAPTTLSRLQLRLEAKLAKVGSQLLGSDTAVPVQIATLYDMRFLTEEEATTARRILTLGEAQLARTREEDREAFLAAADTLVAGFRAAVLKGMVRAELQSEGWDVEPIPGFRRDLLAVRGTIRLHVVPLFVVNPNSRLLERVLARVTMSRDDGPDAQLRVIVTPPNSRSATTDDREDPLVVRLDELMPRLARSAAARS